MSEKDIDSALVTQVLKGDREAFDVLVLKYQQRIANLIGKIIDDHSLVKDVTQESFIKAYRSLAQFNGESAFYTWLYRIAINTAKNHAKIKRRQNYETTAVDFNDVRSLPNKIRMRDYTTPETWLQSDEMQDALMSAVNNLPDELRVSIILRELAGLSYDEIAELMDCPIGTVRSRIFRARTVVDETIKPWTETR